MFKTIAIDMLHFDIYGLFIGLYVAGIAVIPVANEIVSDKIFGYLEKKGKETTVKKAVFRPLFSFVLCFFWLECSWLGLVHFGGVEIFPALLLAMYILQLYLGTSTFKWVKKKATTPKEPKPKMIKKYDPDTGKKYYVPVEE